MAWIPVVLFAFKALVFLSGMYFAIKWHYDKGQKKKQQALSQAQALKQDDIQAPAGGA